MATINGSTADRYGVEHGQPGTPQPSSSLVSEEYVEKAMPAVLGSLDMTAVYLVAIFFIVNAVTAASGGAAAFTYLLLGGVTFFIPCVIATAQLGVMFPHEGSLYNWTHRALGGYWSFFIGFCAWFPGVLVIVAGGDILVSFIQGLNPNWLVEPWQQGVFLILIIAFTGFISTLRLRMVQYMVNMVIALIFLAVAILAISAIVWLLKGHPVATDLRFGSGWSINSGNMGLFGLITLAYLGTEVPLNMGGEMRKQNTARIVRSHLLWGTILVFVGYFIATFAVLVVEGSSAAQVGGFALVNTVSTVLGPVAADTVAICIMCFFLVVPIVYNTTFARLLLVGGIDQRLPMNVGRLNRNRVPVNAIMFQTVVAIGFTVLAFLVFPYVVRLGGKPSDLSIEVYNVSQATATLVWAISTAFFFIDILILYFRERLLFLRARVVPLWVLWLCVLVGPLSCLIAIIDTLMNSWIGQISNSNWLYIVGGVTLASLVLAAIGSMLASSEAAWQGLNEGK